MPARLLLIALLAAGGLVFVVPGRVLACSCVPSPPFEKSVKEADAVFAGAVASSEQVSGVETEVVAPTYGEFVYTFNVDEVVSGEVGATVEVHAYSSSAACGIQFREGDRYVVFAYERRGDLETNLCSRTERINETVTFGGSAPAGGPGAETSTGAETGSDPLPVLVGAAAVLGVGVLLVLVRSLRAGR